MYCYVAEISDIHDVKNLTVPKRLRDYCTEAIEEGEIYVSLVLGIEQSIFSLIKGLNRKYSPSEMPRVFFVTGTSTGFGFHLVQEILDKGDIAVATARKPESLSFNGTSDKNYLALKLDVTQDADIDAAFKTAVDKFGRVDIVVNNAGYGFSAPFEESTPEQIRTQMEVNFFGLLQVTRKAMEIMREQQPSGGLIQQITSIGGQRGCDKIVEYAGTVHR